MNKIDKLRRKYYNDDFKEKFLYLIFGALTTLINIIVYYFFVSILKMNYFIANVIAWFFSVIFAFVTNKIFVFRSDNNELKKIFQEVATFLVARILSLFLDSGVMFIFVQLIRSNDILAKMISNVLVIIFNYFASKLIIFKKDKFPEV